IFFNDYPNTSQAFVTAASPGNLDLGAGGGGVVENSTTGNDRTCISTALTSDSSAAAGGIGYISAEADLAPTGSAAGRTMINIDGQGDGTATAANDLSKLISDGTYDYWYEVVGLKKPGLAGAPLTLANKLLTITSTQTSGPTTPNVAYLQGLTGISNSQTYPLTAPPAGKK